MNGIGESKRKGYLLPIIQMENFDTTERLYREYLYLGIK